MTLLVWVKRMTTAVYEKQYWPGRPLAKAKKSKARAESHLCSSLALLLKQLDQEPRQYGHHQVNTTSHHAKASQLASQALLGLYEKWRNLSDIIKVSGSWSKNELTFLGDKLMKEIIQECVNGSH